ncbi:hypothetical protein MHY85_10470 [Cellulomonas sp. ACRRI]|uniref:hypothetical protein n=1 Tax=Cellulomonas sp. ACRRI TaxID=2918188 RepID=UPI001EF2023A|nr:hypothetical protein [Cellulomonas sp. ACRRI]MCG7286392.1 hypothetical protein [Cellulomonas sp. ACRRI]
MSAARRSWTPWALHPQVKLAEGGSIALEEVGHEAAPPFYSAAGDELFALSLHAPPGEHGSRAVGAASFSQVVLCGRAPVLVGAVDLGRERGLKVINSEFDTRGYAADVLRWLRPSGAPTPASDSTPKGSDLDAGT